MMPSVDRVGRYYPLTLAQAVDGKAVTSLFLSDSDWFAQLEEAALSALAEPFELDSFERTLAGIAAPDQGGSYGFQTDSSPDFGASRAKLAYRFDLDSLGQANLLFPLLSQKLLDKFLPCYSLWSTQGAHHSRPNFLCCESLPPVDAYADFLKGAPQYSNSWNCQIYRQPDNLPLPASYPAPGAQTKPSSVSPDLPVWVSYGITVVGNKRKHNEDAMLNCPERGLWVVADGMGGHQSGDLASRLLVDSLAEMQATDSFSAQIDWIYARLSKVNDDLCRFATGLQQGSVIGTTVVVLLAQGGECAAIWAGDSRLYQLRHGKFRQLTRDHTLLDELMASGMMSREVALQQVGANVITRAVGGQAKLELDVIRFQAERGDRYLLCSDGLDKELTEEDIAEFMLAETCQQAAEAMINTALSRSGRDNITVVVSSMT
jgi:type VI secretion system protein ImpM